MSAKQTAMKRHRREWCTVILALKPQGWLIPPASCTRSLSRLYCRRMDYSADRFHPLELMIIVARHDDSIALERCVEWMPAGNHADQVDQRPAGPPGAGRAARHIVMLI